MHKLGKTVGLLYATSTTGSLIGTVGTGFILIAYFPINQIFFFTGGSLIVLSVLYFVCFKKERIALILLVIPFLLPTFKDRSTNFLENRTMVRKVYEADTFYGNIQVLDHRYPDKYVRVMLVDGINQGGIDLNNGMSVYAYYYYLQYIPFSLNSRGKTCLVIGLGPGIIPMWYEKMGITTDVIDINPEIFAVAKNFFGFHSKGDKIIGDTRYCLNRSTKRYDYIILDVFNGENTPAHVLSRESFQLIYQRMNSGGILGINLLGSVKGETFVMSSVIKTMKEIFTTVEIFPTFDSDKHHSRIGNLVIIAYNFPAITLPRERLKSFPFHPNVASARDRIGERFTFPPETPGVILTDNYNPLDFYDLKVKEEIRKWLLRPSTLEMLL